MNGSNKMTYAKYKYLMRADYQRISVIYGGEKYILLKILLYTHLNLIFFFRTASYLRNKRNIFARIIYNVIKFIYYRKQLITGIQLPIGTEVGGGLHFIHFSDIVIAASSIIGENCTILNGVTLGHSFSARKDGTPTLGDNVVVFTGAKLLGAIHIGNRAVIAANAVVTKDVPENCIVAGNPARIISYDTSSLFGNRWSKDYER